MVVADVVEMRVAGNRDQRRFKEPRILPGKTDDAEPRIQQQAAIATTHVPDVAPVEHVDERLVHLRNAVRVRGRRIPLARLGAVAGVHRAPCGETRTTIGGTGVSTARTKRGPSGP